jgi:type IV pilus assembly protein PilM
MMLFKKQSLGIEITHDGMRMVLAGGKDSDLKLESFGDVRFPGETLRISLKEPNVLNPEAFVGKIREAYLLLLTKAKRVSLSLPDSAGRVVLLDLETRFKSKDEGADIIRWKLKKSFPYEIQEAHLDYQVIQEKETGEISTLVSLMAKQVVNQYEELLLEAGLQPNKIDLTSFNLYRLYAKRFDLAEDYAFLISSGGMLGVMLFSAGALSFYRTKEIPGSGFEVNRAFREISSSLLVYKEKHAVGPLKEVFCHVSPADREVFRSVVVEATGLDPIWLDVERLVARSGPSTVDSPTLFSLAAALGAASRNL